MGRTCKKGGREGGREEGRKEELVWMLWRREKSLAPTMNETDSSAIQPIFCHYTD
jgi:hypothetical protein